MQFHERTIPNDSASSSNSKKGKKTRKSTIPQRQSSFPSNKKIKYNKTDWEVIMDAAQRVKVR